MKYQLIDGKPVPKKLAPAMLRVKAKTGATLTSCLRNQAAVSWARRRGAALSSQAELYAGFVQGRQGFNPANRPGQSTHELRSDGAAYAGPVGRPLAYWQVGQDWGTGAAARAVVQAYDREGFDAMITYPGNSRELHHVNLRRKPPAWLLALLKPWKRGMRGAYVKRLKSKLHYVHDPDTHRPYFAAGRSKPKRGWGPWFDRELEQAVSRFQRDHGQAADGIVGVKTKRQLKASYRTARRRAKEGKR